MPRQPDADPVALAAVLSRIFPGARCHLQRTETGVSTPVYRVRRADAVFYLRLSEAPEDSLAPEVYIHTQLRERGVKAPEVIYFEPFAGELQRSVMLTTEIPGESLAACPAASDLAQVLRAAGRDLALINSLPVAGFGWIRRDRAEIGRLDAEHRTHRGFVFEYLEADLQLLGAGTLKRDEVDRVRAVAEHLDTTVKIEQARLAHGDFDVTPIFQRGGRYTGIIDFGEIRGADPLCDLAHFALHDGETFPRPLLAYLLAGYVEIAPLPPGYEQRIRNLSLLIGVRALAHGLGRPHAVFLARRVRELIAELRPAA